jgi:hypothetical protein
MLHWLNSYFRFDRRITHSPVGSRQSFLKANLRKKLGGTPPSRYGTSLMQLLA